MKTLQKIILILLFSTLHYSQTEWFKYPGNPVLIPGPENWDIGSVAFGKVLFDSSEYKMWYTGGTTSSNNLRIGYATSPDGMEWIKHSSNPVLIPGDPGSWESGAVGTPTVIRDGDTLKMWYAASTTNPPSQIQIGYATSVDGKIWIKHPDNPVIELGSPGEWDDFWVTLPTVVFDGTYKMWYTGSRLPIGTERIGYATSPDGINWTKYDNPSTPNAPYAESDPVLEVTPGNWDSYLVYQPCVFRNYFQLGVYFEMWYTGNTSTGIQKIGYATSPDGIEWDKHPDPVLTESSDLLAPSVAFNGTVYRMWYTGSDRRINYAATDPSAVPVELESFTAVTIGNNINLTWVTATELNNHGFEIFRNGNKIAFVEGKGTTIEKQEYIYTDRSLKDGIYNYRLEQIDFDGKRNIISTELTIYLTLPEKFSLEQNYPNPFNPSTVIGYQLPVSSNATLKIYDLLGREVATLVDEYKPAGSYEFEFDGSKLASGVYLYKLTAGEYTSTRKLVLMK